MSENSVKEISITDKTNQLALLAEIPVLKKICGDKRISVIDIQPAVKIIEFGSPCGMGYNSEGWAYGIFNGEILYEKTWGQIRKLQIEKALPEPYLTRAQAILTGNEDMFVFVQEHLDKYNQEKNWISVNVFVAMRPSLFRDYQDIVVWMTRPQVREKLKGLVF